MKPPGAESLRNYVSAWIALLLLLGLTVGAADLHLGAWNSVVALAIATIKALLVILFFMHARRGLPLVRVFAVTAFFWLVILVSLTLTDILSRGAPGFLR